MGRKPLPADRKRRDQITLAFSVHERQQLNRLMELGGYITAPEAIRAAVSEVVGRLEKKAEKDADKTALRTEP